MSGIADPITRHRLALLLLAGLALRLALAFVVFPRQGFTSDMQSWVDWSQVLATYGPGGFYAHAAAEPPPLPPGFMWVLWPLGILGQVLADLTGTPVNRLAFDLVKLPAITVDIVLAWILYRFVRRWGDERAGLLAAALFLFNPVSWYDSAIWGQVDVVGSLAVVLAIALLVEGRSEAATATAVVAALVKPQFGIGLLVVGVVLVRRHLLVPGSGPVPRVTGWTARLGARLGGLLTRRQGPLRLVSSAVVGLATCLAMTVPFDLDVFSRGYGTSIPVVGDVVGLVFLVRTEAASYHGLTMNAFNPWALVGPTPLADHLTRTNDALRIVDGLSAFAVGTILLASAFVAVGLRLLRTDGRTVILLAATVLALSFFVLPTRVHERYVYLVMAVATPLAAVAWQWRTWYVVLSALGTVNLHAVLTPRVPNLPLGDLATSAPVIWLIALSFAILYGWAAWRLARARPSPPEIADT